LVAVQLGEALSQKGLTDVEVITTSTHDANGFLVGEPMDHRVCKVTTLMLARYEAYIEKRGRYYVSKRPLTINEYRKYSRDFARK
jgi:hypothetical protein